MSRERTIAFMEDLSKRDTEALKKWFNDGSKLWMPPTATVEGQRRILALFRTIFRMYTDIHWKVTEVFQIDANRCVYLTESWGTIGKETPYKNHIMTLIEFDAAGQILFLSDYFKDTAIFQAGRSHAAQ